uniref:ARAD1C18194p n=1 Tax=Blastobotrys adeninivorans TaxID=409370 RepID=A0A060T0U2_BLAAD
MPPRGKKRKAKESQKKRVATQLIDRTAPLKAEVLEKNVEKPEQYVQEDETHSETTFETTEAILDHAEREIDDIIRAEIPQRPREKEINLFSTKELLELAARKIQEFNLAGTFPDQLTVLAERYRQSENEAIHINQLVDATNHSLSKIDKTLEKLEDICRTRERSESEVQRILVLRSRVAERVKQLYEDNAKQKIMNDRMYDKVNQTRELFLKFFAEIFVYRLERAEHKAGIAQSRTGHALVGAWFQRFNIVPIDSYDCECGQLCPADILKKCPMMKQFRHLVKDADSSLYDKKSLATKHGVAAIVSHVESCLAKQSL